MLPAPARWLHRTARNGDAKTAALSRRSKGRAIKRVPFCRPSLLQPPSPRPHPSEHIDAAVVIFTTDFPAVPHLFLLREALTFSSIFLIKGDCRLHTTQLLLLTTKVQCIESSVQPVTAFAFSPAADWNGGFLKKVASYYMLVYLWIIAPYSLLPTPRRWRSSLDKALMIACTPANAGCWFHTNFRKKTPAMSCAPILG